MIKRKLKECKHCGKMVYYWAKKSCKSCYHKHEKKSIELKKAPINNKYKPTGEKALFDSIWKTSDKKSFLSGRYLMQYENTSMYVNLFAHVLAKGKYPKFRLLDRNIILLHPQEHYLLDMGTIEQREKYALEWECDWNKIYELKESFKQEYEALNQKNTYQKNS